MVKKPKRSIITRMDLFKDSETAAIAAHAPLAVRMRPVTIDEILGQDEFLAPGRMLRRMLDAGTLSSLVFYGPPGTGKTTLASVIAGTSDCEYHALNAASATVRDVREVIQHARAVISSSGRRTVLFIDELHRFNKAQQDVLLDDVENGVIILVGATTENPFFTINSPLLSRSTIFEFKPLADCEIITLLKRTIEDTQRGFGGYDIEMTQEAFEHIAKISDGDARRALNALEIGVLSQIRSAGRDDIHVLYDLNVAQESIQSKIVDYDRTGDGHYDAVSAFIKSMRGSDPDATVYWLAKMLVAGEDPRFIARRIAILASEDIGNADPRAITVAASAWQITERVGMPECRITLAQAAIYMACTVKSNASYKAISDAIQDVKNHRAIPVPKHLRNAPHPGMGEILGNARGYQYSHNYPGGVSPDQDYLGVDRKYYTPLEHGYEKHIISYLEWIETLQSDEKKSSS